jgi:heme exporter protein B
MRSFVFLLQRDLRCVLRSRADAFNPVLFFVLIISLFPLGVGGQPADLAPIAPGILCVAALLASLLALDNLFRLDFYDGTLEQLLLSPVPLPALVLAKICAHWLAAGAPLVILSPLLGAMLYLPASAHWGVMAIFAVATPILSALGAIGAALTVGLRRAGLLLALLVLPLFVPVLVFSAAGVAAAASGMPYGGHVAVLGAMLIAALMLAPFAIASALRISVAG